MSKSLNKSDQEFRLALAAAQNSPRPWTRELSQAVVLANDLASRFYLVKEWGGYNYANAQKRRLTKMITNALEVRSE